MIKAKHLKEIEAITTSINGERTELYGQVLRMENIQLRLAIIL